MSTLKKVGRHNVYPGSTPVNSPTNYNSRSDMWDKSRTGQLAGNEFVKSTELRTGVAISL